MAASFEERESAILSGNDRRAACAVRAMSNAVNRPARERATGATGAAACDVAALKRMPACGRQPAYAVSRVSPLPRRGRRA
ncbi:hypothetical protein [Burkholderia sp. BCC1977]|uniref:hypothetical protein n=1 Tax=Burkholderia sp. BCC1977 TaxID=2817440 RepID=UPI002ABE7C6A|nr:hypothetical protein [Burkholderia sp. BCC1977]